MAPRHGQEPPGARAGTTARSASPARRWLRTSACLEAVSFFTGPDPAGPAGAGRIHDPLRRSICHVPDRRPSVDSLTRAGGSQSHVIDPMVESRFRFCSSWARRSRAPASSHKGGRRGAAHAARQDQSSPRRRAVTFRAKPGTLDVTIVERGRSKSARNARRYCNVEGGDHRSIARPRGHACQERSDSL